MEYLTVEQLDRQLPAIINAIPSEVAVSLPTLRSQLSFKESHIDLDWQASPFCT